MNIFIREQDAETCLKAKGKSLIRNAVFTHSNHSLLDNRDDDSLITFGHQLQETEDKLNNHLAFNECQLCISFKTVEMLANTFHDMGSQFALPFNLPFFVRLFLFLHLVIIIVLKIFICLIILQHINGKLEHELKSFQTVHKHCMYLIFLGYCQTFPHFLLHHVLCCLVMLDGVDVVTVFMLETYISEVFIKSVEEQGKVVRVVAFRGCGQETSGKGSHPIGSIIGSTETDTGREVAGVLAPEEELHGQVSEVARQVVLRPHQGHHSFKQVLIPLWHIDHQCGQQSQHGPHDVVLHQWQLSQLCVHPRPIQHRNNFRALLTNIVYCEHCRAYHRSISSHQHYHKFGQCLRLQQLLRDILQVGNSSYSIMPYFTINAFQLLHNTLNTHCLLFIFSVLLSNILFFYYFPFWYHFFNNHFYYIFFLLISFQPFFEEKKTQTYMNCILLFYHHMNCIIELSTNTIQQVGPFIIFKN